MVVAFTTCFDEDGFWKMYFACQSGEVSGLRKRMYTYIIRRTCAFHCSDLMVTNSTQRRFGPYFLGKPYLPHGLNGIVISDQAQIGKNCTILQQVTIGVKSLQDKGVPQIGDGVFIGAGAKVIGNISVGNNAIIGANAVVISDIPDGATAVGNPARIILKQKG